MDFRADLTAMDAATQRLLAAVEGLTDADVAAPSRLPGWTRGHVLTHLARNADMLRNLAHWARTGEERQGYASPEQRDADIAAGAPRPAREQVADLVSAAQRLAADLSALDEAGQGRRIALRGKPLLGAALPARRSREVEIHLVDLALDYTPAHWPAPFVLRALDDLAPMFQEMGTPVRALVGAESGRRWEVGQQGPSLTGQESGLLAWLTGRSDGDGLLVEDVDGAVAAPVPAPPRWG